MDIHKCEILVTLRPYQIVQLNSEVLLCVIYVLLHNSSSDIFSVVLADLVHTLSASTKIPTYVVANVSILCICVYMVVLFVFMF